MYPAFCEAMGWQDPAEFSTPQPTRTGHPLSVARTPSPPVRRAPPVKVDVRRRLGRQHPRPDKEAEQSDEAEGGKDSHPEDNQEEAPTYRIPWTATALLRRSQNIRHRMAAEVQTQMVGIREAIARGRADSVEKACALHAELEILRQAYTRLGH